MVVVEALFWLCVAAIGWTHAGYPLVAAVLARVRRREIRKADILPRVVLIVAPLWTVVQVLMRLRKHGSAGQGGAEVGAAADRSTQPETASEPPTH